VEAPQLQTHFEEYEDQGLMIVTLLVEKYDGTPPEQSDLEGWALDYGQTFPVLSDPDWLVTDRFMRRPGENPGHPALPSTSLLGRGMQVLLADRDITEEDILAALE
jgi:hypothetical protein